jgi:antitoxin VapB
MSHSISREPVPANWAWLDAIAGKLDDDFVEVVDEQPPEQERPALDGFFCC